MRDWSEVRPASGDKSPPSWSALQEVKRLERGETSQRGQVAADLVALVEVERLERGEASQRGQVAELVAL